jgi:hypothetical protein
MVLKKSISSNTNFTNLKLCAFAPLREKKKKDNNTKLIYLFLNKITKALVVF